MKKCEYDVNISPADNGLIVRVGCKTVVVEEAKVDEALSDIKKLLIEGYQGQREVRKKWLKEEELQCVDAPVEQTCAQVGRY